MSDIKKKFIDIFFEPEEEEPIKEEEEKVSYTSSKDILAAFKKEKEKEKALEEENKEEIPTINAKDLLYRKPGQSAFINLDNNSKSSNFSFNEKNEYVMSSQISPMFGVLNEKKKKKSKNVISEEKKNITKSNESHLDIVISPIYGYGNREDEYISKKDKTAEVEELLKEDGDEVFDALSNGKDDSEINLFDLFGDED